MSSSKKFDVLIVGSGIGGLMASILLAKEGKSVLLLEKSSSLAGRANTQEKSGFKFNLGPHALYNNSFAYHALKKLGIPIIGKVVKATTGLLLGEEKTYTLPTTLTNIFSTTAFNSFSARVETLKVMFLLSTINLAKIKEQTLEEWFSTNIKNDETKDFFRTLAMVATYSVNPNKSAKASLFQLKKALFNSVYYLDNGWESLVTSLETKAKTLGVSIITNTKVTKVKKEPFYQIVETQKGDTYFSEIVIINSSPKISSELVPESKYLETWSKKLIPIKASCLDIALSKLPNPKNISCFGFGKPWYFSVHSKFADLGKNGVVIHLAKYLDNEIINSENNLKELESILDKTQKGWRMLILEKRYMPSLVVSHALVTQDKNGKIDRPEVVVEDHSNLFIIGDWVGQKGMLLDASISSVEQVVNIILTQKNKKYERELISTL